MNIPTWRCEQDICDNPSCMLSSGETEAPLDEITELREKLRLLKEIQNVQSQIHPDEHRNGPSQTQLVMCVKPPEGSYTMSPANYHTYKKDCIAYQELTNLTDHQVVLQLRLSMDTDLKIIIDTNFPQWDTMTVTDAIKTVGEIVKVSSNPVVYRKHFHELVQLRDEPIQGFVTKLRACAIDCAFVCPYNETHDLTDDHIINRILTGIYDQMLQQEILQKHETLNTVDLLVKYCENFESTKNDRARLNKPNPDHSISTIYDDLDLTEGEIVAAVSAYKRQKQQFIPKPPANTKVEDDRGYCGYQKHNQKPCPASGKFCLKCGKKGHFSSVLEVTICVKKAKKYNKSVLGLYFYIEEKNRWKISHHSIQQYQWHQVYLFL